MKLVKGIITTDEDENVIMSKDTFYEMDNNFNITLKENRQLKGKINQAIEEINYMITNADITEISAIKLKQILGDKE